MAWTRFAQQAPADGRGDYDCEALLCRGMGSGAYESMQLRGIPPMVTDIEAIEDAVLAYVRGDIIDLVDKLH